jgi:hypothetical protein
VQLIGWKKAERRRWKRYSFNLPVRVVTDSAVVDARCIRMSVGGIYLFAAADLPPGAEIKIEFTTDASGNLLSRSGIVRHRAIYLYGVEFLAGERRDPESALQPAEVPPAPASVLPN